MTTKNLNAAQRKRAKRAKRAQRKRAKRAQRKYRNMIATGAAIISRRLDRIAYAGWDHTNTRIIGSLNRSVWP